MRAAEAPREQSAAAGTVMRESALRFASTVVILVVTQISGIIVARVLGAEGKGVQSILGLVSTIALLPVDLGVSAASVYMVGRRRVDAQTLLSNLVSCSIVGGAVLVSLFAAGGSRLAELLFEGLHQGAVELLAVGLPASLVGGWWIGILRGQNRLLTGVLIQLGGALCAAGALVVFLLGFGMEADGIAWSLNAGALATMLASGAALWSQGLRFAPRLAGGVLRETFGYGLRTQAGVVLQMVNYRFDLFVANAVLGTAAAGVYAVAAGVTELLLQVPNAFSFVLLSRGAAAESADAAEMSVTVARISFTISLAGAVVLVPVSFVLVPLVFGNEFSLAGWPIAGLAGGVVMLSHYKVLATYLAARGKPECYSYAAALSAVVTLLLDLLLMPRWGIWGAAVASSLAYSVAAIMTIIWFRRTAGVFSVASLFVPRRSDLDVVTSLMRRGRKSD